MTASSRLAARIEVMLGEATQRVAMEHHRHGRLVSVSLPFMRGFADGLARKTADQAGIAKLKPKELGRLPGGRKLLRDYATAAVAEFRRQERAFDAWATVHHTIARVAAMPKRTSSPFAGIISGIRADTTDDSGILDGYDPQYDPTEILSIQLATYLAAGQNALDSLGISDTFTLTSAEYTQRVRNLLLDQIVGIDETTKAGLLALLIAHAGDTPQEIGAAIAEFWDQRSLGGGVLIAITESARAAAGAEIDTYGNNGITQVVWQGDSPDQGGGGASVNCNDFIGTTYDLTDADGLLPAHAACRCYWEPVIPDSWSAPSDPWTGGDVISEEQAALDELGGE